MTSKKEEKKGRRQKKKMRKTQTKWNTNQSTKNNPIGFDTIVNSPSLA
jgi:hypothetical protein